jgi:hypothetical protein
MTPVAWSLVIVVFVLHGLTMASSLVACGLVS